MTQPQPTTRRRSAPAPDVDLDAEAVYLEDGTRLTEAKAAELAEWALDQRRRRRGRPSVSGGAQRTPNLTMRVAPATRAALEGIAAAQGRRLADVGREALDEYVSRHATGGVEAAGAGEVTLAPRLLNRRAGSHTSGRGQR